MAENVVNIRYEADTQKQMDENLKKAEADYDRLISEGHPVVRIIISNHWASEGIWVEAGKTKNKTSSEAFIYKSNI